MVSLLVSFVIIAVYFLTITFPIHIIDMYLTLPFVLEVIIMGTLILGIPVGLIFLHPALVFWWIRTKHQRS